jgi:predicted TPR repeat methyltransferase
MRKGKIGKSGMDFFRNDKYSDALAYYDAILEKDPENINALNNRACMLAHMGDFGGALTIFNTILSRDPSNSMALSNQATLLGKQGDYDAAIQGYTKILKDSPHSLATRISCINLLTFLGRYKEALACNRTMPRPPAMTYMLLGSLSDDFKQLISLKGRMPEKIRQMKEYRHQKKVNNAADSGPKFISLLFAPDE